MTPRPVTRAEIERIGGVPLPDQHADKIVAGIRDRVDNLIRDRPAVLVDAHGRIMRQRLIGLAICNTMNNIHTKVIGSYERRSLDPIELLKICGSKELYERIQARRKTSPHHQENLVMYKKLDAALERAEIDAADWSEKHAQLLRTAPKTPEFVSHRLQLWPICMKLVEHESDWYAFFS